MSFPMANRFDYYLDNIPSPSTYNVTGTLNEAKAGSSNLWVKPNMDVHRCDENCSPEVCSKLAKELGIQKRSPQNRRLSLNPHCLKKASLSLKHDDNHLKETHQRKRRLSLSLQQSENKENVALSPSMKQSSHIPRFRRNSLDKSMSTHLTKSQATSSTGALSTEHAFDRNSLKRKSMKPLKRSGVSTENKSETKNKSNLLTTKKLNISYTVLPKFGSNETVSSKSSDDNNTDKKRIKRKDVTKEKIHEIDLTDVNFDMNSSISLKVAQKDLELSKDLLNVDRTRTYYNICSIDEREDEFKEDDSQIIGIEKCGEQLRNYEIFALKDCNMIFLVNEEFIDDEYDSYIREANGKRISAQVLKNKELYEMTKSLVDVYLKKDKPDQKLNTLKKNRSMKLDQSLCSRIGNLMKRKKNRRKNILNEVEGVVKQAIMHLKDEFQEEILEASIAKMDKMIEELKRTVHTSNRDIENICERATGDLIVRLENIAMKS